LIWIQEDDGVHYYASNNVHNNANRNPGVKVKKDGAAEYPFEDDFGNDNKPNNNNDFDPLSGPAEDNSQVDPKGKSGNQKAAKVNKGQQNPGEAKHQTVLMDQLTCDVNHGKYMIDCMKDQDNEVYVPFSFLHKYFEVGQGSSVHCSCLEI